jgi:hypothetical protein
VELNDAVSGHVERSPNIPGTHSANISGGVQPGS